jgi:hypothetical protein
MPVTITDGGIVGKGDVVFDLVVEAHRLKLNNVVVVCSSAAPKIRIDEDKRVTVEQLNDFFAQSGQTVRVAAITQERLHQSDKNWRVAYCKLACGPIWAELRDKNGADNALLIECTNGYLWAYPRFVGAHPIFLEEY